MRSIRLLSMMDHAMPIHCLLSLTPVLARPAMENEDVQYLIQPRGPSNSWAFRMVTPRELVGIQNAQDYKPFGCEIRRGLRTRHLPQARKHRDILLGDVRRLQHGLTNEARWSLQSALDWRQAWAEAL